MEYFDFSAHDDRVFIPKSRHSLKQKTKSCLIDRNRISKIKNAPSLDKYNYIISEKEAKKGAL